MTPATSPAMARTTRPTGEMMRPMTVASAPTAPTIGAEDGDEAEADENEFLDLG